MPTIPGDPEGSGRDAADIRAAKEALEEARRDGTINLDELKRQIDEQQQRR